MTAYERTLAELYALETARGIDLGLDRVRRALDRLGAPHERFRVFHVAGTNGKGSTAAMVEAALRAGGYRVGLYTSPHLVDFSERIRVDGRTIPEEEVVERVAALRSILSAAGIELTFFELASVLAFDAFARRGIDVAVVEVGLGGRLDATNVTTPVASAVTTIAHDHEAYLGNTLEAIAGEKAGIMKPGVPVVIGAVPPAGLKRLAAEAAHVGAPALVLGREVVVRERGEAEGFDVVCAGRAWPDVRLALAGRFQRANAAVALQMLECGAASFPLSEEAVRAGLETVRWPGRLDVVSRDPLVILDGAHNPAAAAALAEEIGRLGRGRHVRLVFGAMRDKDSGSMWRALRRVVDDVVCTAPDLPRALAPERLAETIGSDCPVHVRATPADAVTELLASASPMDLILVTGSLFLVGDVYGAFLRRQGRRRLFDPWHVGAPGVTQAPA
jgi:dihydrofolate synthase/folylpolyglutamate synthase